MNLPRFPWKPPSSRQNTRANPMLFPWSLRYVSLNSSYHLVMWHGNGKWAMASATMTSPGKSPSETLFFSPSIIMNSHESTIDNPPLITIDNPLVPMTSRENSLLRLERILQQFDELGWRFCAHPAATSATWRPKMAHSHGKRPLPLFLDSKPLKKDRRGELDQIFSVIFVVLSFLQF